MGTCFQKKVMKLIAWATAPLISTYSRAMGDNVDSMILIKHPKTGERLRGNFQTFFTKSGNPQ